MKPGNIVIPSIKRILTFIGIVFTSFTAAGQPPRQLNPNLYRNFTRSDAQVKIQMIENGSVRKTDTATLGNLRVPSKQKAVISFKKSSAIDEKSLEDFKGNLKLPYKKEDVKLIPELHVESSEGSTEMKAYGIVFTLEQPLHYDESLNKFSATIGFLLASETESNYTPIEPVKIEVVSNDVSFIEPASFEIDHLSIPSAKVKLVAANVRDSVAVKVITVTNTTGYVTYLKVKPRLSISTNRSRLQGFGIQEIPVTVLFEGSSSSDSVTVTLSPEKGTVSPDVVSVKFNEPTKVYLRSEGMGTSKLSAITSNAQSNSLSFRFVFPWLFLLATIAGGLIGSLTKFYSNPRKKKLTPKLLIAGILTGFVGAAAYYFLGINLLGISFNAAFNEIAVLIISALFAYLGIKMMKLE
jgi:hypothetical protein